MWCILCNRLYLWEICTFIRIHELPDFFLILLKYSTLKRVFSYFHEQKKSKIRVSVLCRVCTKLLITDKETDESWDIFMIWKINSWLVLAAVPVLWKIDYEQLLKPVFYVFMGKKRVNFFLKILYLPHWKVA